MLPQEQINLYIAEQPEWQRRTLVRLRQIIHSVDETIEEAWRWNMPHYDHDGLLIGTTALKDAVCVWFHRGAQLKDTHKLFAKAGRTDAKGLRKVRITEGDALDEKAILDLVKQAVKVNIAGATETAASPRSGRRRPEVPEELDAVLRKDEEAWACWERMKVAQQRAYVEWITDAREDEIRKRRVAQAYQQIRAGEPLDVAGN